MKGEKVRKGGERFVFGFHFIDETTRAEGGGKKR
jgi:hypothetical protein